MKHITKSGIVAFFLVTGCYGSAHNQRAEAETAWATGRAEEALVIAGQMYGRYADDNRQASRAVPDAMVLITERLADELVVPSDIGLHAPPDVAIRDAGLKPAASLHGELLDATLSLDAGRVLPAILSIQALGLTRFARALFVVLDRPEPFVDSSKLTRGLNVAVRSLIVKRAALDALKALARPQLR